MEVQITLAVPADAGELWTVQRAAYVSEAVAYDNARIPPLTESLDEVTTRLTDGTLVLKAVLGHRIIGTASGRRIGDAGYIGRLAVAPDLQGRGVGSRLLAELEARMPGARRFELFTGGTSEANIRLYRRHGYTEFDRRPDPAGVMLVYLEKTVALGADSA